MESKIKVLGHPVHQMLVVFPVGLLMMAGIFDAIYFITGYAALGVVSYWNIAAGIIGGVIAAIFGLIDWIGIPQRTRAKRIGAWHAAGNVVVLALFAASWLIRTGQASYLPTPAAFIVEIVAVAIGAVTAWLGGEFVDRLGVGVDPGAHLNAPSSLSEKPASASAR